MEALLSSLALTPIDSSSIIGVLLIVFSVILYFRRNRLNEITTLGKMQEEQVKILMEQVKTLSQQLNEARLELKEIHEQNLSLLQKVNDYAIHIRDLESMMGCLIEKDSDGNNVFPIKKISVGA